MFWGALIGLCVGVLMVYPVLLPVILCLCLFRCYVPDVLYLCRFTGYTCLKYALLLNFPGLGSGSACPVGCLGLL